VAIGSSRRPLNIYEEGLTKLWDGRRTDPGPAPQHTAWDKRTGNTRAQRTERRPPRNRENGWSEDAKAIYLPGHPDRRKAISPDNWNLTALPDRPIRAYGQLEAVPRPDKHCLYPA